MSDIAERLSVSKRTVESWRQRGQLIEPRWTINGSTPVWHWPEVARWHELKDSPVRTIETQAAGGHMVLAEPEYPIESTSPTPACIHRWGPPSQVTSRRRCTECGAFKP